jgi:sugar phosphate isomerase/epimerase
LFVAASTRCFPAIPFMKCMQRLAELDFHSVELVVGFGESDLNPRWLEQDLPRVARMCLCQRRLTPVAIYMDVDPGRPQYYSIFENCVRLCQTLKVVVLVVKSSPVGFPFNEEFERLRNLARFGRGSGIVVSVLTERDSISGSIDSIISLCNGTPELSIALDPSHFIYGYEKPINYESIIPMVSHVKLRDTTESEMQVQIGQGVLEFSKLVSQLRKATYRGALSVDLLRIPNTDPESELRKMRLLVESNLF